MIFHRELGRGASLETVRTMAVSAVVVAEMYSPPLQAVFGSAPLAPGDLLKVMLAGLFVFTVAELEKAILRAACGKPGRARGG